MLAVQCGICGARSAYKHAGKLAKQLQSNMLLYLPHNSMLAEKSDSLSPEVPSSQTAESPSLSRRGLLIGGTLGIAAIVTSVAHTVWSVSSIANNTNTPREHEDPRVNDLRNIFGRMLEIEHEMRNATSDNREILHNELADIEAKFQAYRLSKAAPLPPEGNHFIHGILQTQQRIKINFLSSSRGE